MSDGRQIDGTKDGNQPSRQPVFPRPVLVRHSQLSERRATGATERYWNNVRGDNLVPSLSDVDMEPASASWDNRFLIRRDREIPHSVFIVCGLGARQALGMPALGHCMNEVLPPSIAEEIYQACAMASRDLRPEHLQGEFAGTDGRRMLFRSVFMPLRALSNDLGYIFGAFSARAMHA